MANTPRKQFRLDDNIWEKLQEVAERNEQNRSEVLRDLVFRYIKENTYTNMQKQLEEFFSRCLETVEILSQREGNEYENTLWKLAEDLEGVAEAIRENEPENILEY